MSRLFFQKLLTAAFLLALWMTSAQPTLLVRASAVEELPTNADYVPGELIVGFEKGNGLRPTQERMASLASMAHNWNASLVSTAVDGSFALLRFKSDADLQAQMSAVASLPGVAYVERNGIIRLADMGEGDASGQSVAPSSLSSSAPLPGLYQPDDEWVGEQWYLEKIMYHLAPDPVNTDVPCIVIIDSGVDYTHPDLAGKVFLGRDTYSGDDDPKDENGHGTQVAGVAAAVTGNAQGIAGVSPFSNILAVRVLGPTGTGTFAQVAQGIAWANSTATASLCGGQEPKIYNISWGTTTNSLAIANAIADAKNMGRLVVAAAGASNTSQKFYPAADPNVMGVAATENNDRRMNNSNFGTTTSPWISIAAPGDNILTTVMGNRYEARNGTVLAAPMVAGAAARVWAQYPTWTAAQVWQQLINTGDPTAGFPAPLKRINLLRALGGNATPTIQGQIFDASLAAPMPGATVTVNQSNTVYCTVTTNSYGFYSCALPATGTYTVQVEKSGYITDSRAFTVNPRRFNAHIAMSPTTPSTGDWSVVALWRGYQPQGTVIGKEFDLWIVRAGGGTCYSTYNGASSNLLVTVGENSFLKGQAENIQIYKAYNGVAQVWVALYDGGYWPASSRLTGSELSVAIYKNNTRVALLTAPTLPTTTTADIWYVGDINTVTGVWTKRNRILTNATDPACIKSPTP
ncbi:MAG: S8 family serine peptidase [Anaerolineae bacterium]